MKTRNHLPVVALAMFALVSPHPAHAQFTGNDQTNIISSVTNNWNGSYFVGSNYVFDALLIKNGGVLSATNSVGYIGYNVGANNNSVIVSGAGSTWSSSTSLVVGWLGAGNTLLITNGGQVICSSTAVGVNTSIGQAAGATSNSVVVSGNGSVWTNSSTLLVGYLGSGNRLVINNGGEVRTGAGVIIGFTAGANGNSVLLSDSGSISIGTGGAMQIGDNGAGNSLVISNGAKAFDDYAYVGNGLGYSNNAIVTGIGSVWSNRFVLAVGVSGSGNSLTIKDGGTVIATNGGAGANPGSTNNLITISGGNLIVTNSTGDARFNIRRGLLTFDGGTITVDNLLLTNSSASVIAFNSGLLNVKATAVTNAQQFVIGDGVGIGNLHLLGGIYSFNDGLRIRANSLLTGCGTVNGSVLVDAGAIVRSDCSTLTFTGNVTNNGAMLADAAVLESSGTLVNNGTIYLFNGGTTNFHGTFINSGSVVNVGAPTISSISRVGNDIVLKLSSVLGLTYQLQSSPALPSGWADAGAPQSGSAGSLIFTDPGAATNAPSRFYRIRVQ
jgi:T5SS/PEP-CTERM-associated repeat protein